MHVCSAYKPSTSANHNGLLVIWESFLIFRRNISLVSDLAFSELVRLVRESGAGSDWVPKSKSDGPSLEPLMVYLNWYTSRFRARKKKLNTSKKNTQTNKNIGPNNFILGGWESQMISGAGKLEGFNDRRFTYFFDLVRSINYLSEVYEYPSLNIFDFNVFFLLQLPSLSTSTTYMSIPECVTLSLTFSLRGHC